MTASQLAFKPGDVIQTEPQEGYWGCAIVLASADGTTNSHPRFHVGITPLVFRHDYAWSELGASGLSLLTFIRDVRMPSGEYGSRSETCIGIYTALTRGEVRVIGEVDPKQIYALPLDATVGNATAGHFPLCGPLTKAIGHEAVVAWRRIHDAGGLARDAEESRKRFEAMEARRFSRNSRLVRTKDA